MLLSRRLFLLVAAGIVPLAVMAAIGLFALVEHQREQAKRSGIEITRALATAIDAELERSISVLEGVSVSESLHTEDLGLFHGVAKRTVDTRPGWLTMILADANGRQLVNASFQPGAPLPALVDPESYGQVIATGKPHVGRLVGGPNGNMAVAVRIPVYRDGSLRYVLTAVVRSEAFLEVLTRQRVPSDWVVSVFDARGSRVARSRQHEQYLGLPAAPSLRALIDAGGEEGSGITRTLEGQSVYTAYSRSRHSGWTVAIGIPPSVVDAAAMRSLGALGSGILLSALAGLLAALLIGRRITHAIAQLRNAAQALGRRERPIPPQTPIVEVREVGHALAKAFEERATAEREREALLKREQEARSTAEQANRAKDEFLAMLGHELRNPLWALSSASRLLEHPKCDPETQARAKRIVARQVEQLTRLTDDLLDAGRAVLGKISLQRAPIDLAKAVEHTLSTLAAAGTTSRHRVVRDLGTAWVDADATRLEQVVSNLVINAVKYTPSGGTIRVSVRKEGDWALLAVVDDGIGMPGELVERVFEPFVQGERSLERSQGGLGIGLTLVRRLVELHGGSVSAHSAGPGAGSAFVVRLPTIAEPSATAAGGAPRGRVAARDILLVEDNPDARETLRALLELAGHRVRIAADGASGVEAALKDRPDIALVDIGLPLIDGYEVARRIRAAGGRRPYLVAITGYGLVEDRQRSLEAGFDLHLVKPVTEGVLEDMLQQAARAA